MKPYKNVRVLMDKRGGRVDDNTTGLSSALEKHILEQKPKRRRKGLAEWSISIEHVENQQEDLLVYYDDIDPDKIQQVWEVKYTPGDMYHGFVSHQEVINKEIRANTVKNWDLSIPPEENPRFFCAFIEPDLSRSRIDPWWFMALVRSAMRQYWHVDYFFKRKQEDLLERIIETIITPPLPQNCYIPVLMKGSAPKSLILSMSALTNRMTENLAAYCIEKYLEEYEKTTVSWSDLVGISKMDWEDWFNLFYHNQTDMTKFPTHWYNLLQKNAKPPFKTMSRYNNK